MTPVWGTIWSPLNGPLTRMLAMPTPMNDIISVVTISLMP